MSVNGRVAKRASLASTIASGSARQSPLHQSLTYILHRRHQALHSAKSQNNLCRGCKKTFSRLDALNVRDPFSYPTRSTLPVSQRHLRSEGGAECRQYHQRTAPSTSILADDQRPADS